MTFLSGKNMTSLFFYVGLLENNQDAYLIKVSEMMNTKLLEWYHRLGAYVFAIICKPFWLFSIAAIIN